jgi:hypothetical protein
MTILLEQKNSRRSIWDILKKTAALMMEKPIMKKVPTITKVPGIAVKEEKKPKAKKTTIGLKTDERERGYRPLFPVFSLLKFIWYYLIPIQKKLTRVDRVLQCLT